MLITKCTLIFFLLLALHIPQLLAHVSKSFHRSCWIFYTFLLKFNYIIAELILPRCNKSQETVLFPQSPPNACWFMQLSSSSASQWSEWQYLGQKAQAVMQPQIENWLLTFSSTHRRLMRIHTEGKKHNILFCWQHAHTIKSIFFNKNQQWLKMHNKCCNINKRCYT